MSTESCREDGQDHEDVRDYNANHDHDPNVRAAAGNSPARTRPRLLGRGKRQPLRSSDQ